MDALMQCELILKQAELGCAVVGTSSLDHLELIDAPAMTYEAAANAAKRGLDFLGVVTITNGVPKSAFVVDMPKDVVVALAELFARRITDEMEVRELQRMYGVVDPRLEN
jgi:hypothetical protein